MLNRRRLLTLGAAAGGAVLLPSVGSSPAGAHGRAAHVHGVRPATTGRAAAVTPFTVRMPVPPVAQPVDTASGVDVYRIGIRSTTAEILPGVRTPVLTYGGSFVGPTIRARKGRPVRVTFGNQLAEHANVHLHGAHVPASSDGHPMDVIAPGQARQYDYPNTQQGATLWYHDHSHHLEAEHVYRGLHGFYVIEDDDERLLALPSGGYDVPILLRDALFDANGQLVFGGNPADRDVILANGRPQPYFPVAARKYRFRLLNGTTERVFTLNLGGVPLTQIATDGGLLPAPIPRTELELGSAERADVVIDFSRFPLGTQLVLADTTGPVLRFDVVRSAEDTSRVPDRLRALPTLPPATVNREVSFSFDLSGQAPIGLMNGVPYDPARNDFTVKRGATEIWRIYNADTEFSIPHTFHMHLTQFQVLDREGLPAMQQDVGLKDTVQVAPGTAVRVKATFTEYTGRYVYHCHFLEHSSAGMMATMEIVP
ncbi:MAG TPA: multicopper oxidase domain-containing protein [Actinophytocola sp.]|uniref:multicopper oxidase family protein n=1 Tax=Actinophytocola sp. TaxID=1872138 RepID=UPI002DDCAFEC|nr:multicopper oxidase domain-containing protein [Actinophytocola sp.]HEV2783518.1 multicopper oxidase domain-containing protein [Actinophytocola sp.]